MKRFVLCIVALMLATTVSAYADWANTSMNAVGTTQTLLLSPSWVQNGSSYDYTYKLFNQTADDYIIGFSLAFPTSVPVGGFSSFVTPTGWQCIQRPVSNKLEWQLIGAETQSLAPGQTFTFGFTSTLAPSTVPNVFASSQDSYGFSANAYGPAVPEPGSLFALGSGLVGLFGFVKRIKK